MVRRNDHSTSVAAAVALADSINALQQKVIEAFEEHGDMTDWKLENLPRFAVYGPSTIRKRRSELYQAKRIVENGVETNPNGKQMKVWHLCTPAETASLSTARKTKNLWPLSYFMWIGTDGEWQIIKQEDVEDAKALCQPGECIVELKGRTVFRATAPGSASQFSS